MVCGAADLHPDFEGFLAEVSSTEQGDDVGRGKGGGASRRGTGGRKGGTQGSENKRYCMQLIPDEHQHRRKKIKK